MDSGNSGSLQSSSGGDNDVEFDSRSAADSSSLSALLRPSSSLFYSLPDLTTQSVSSLPQIQQNAPTWPSSQFQPSSSQLPLPTQTPPPTTTSTTTTTTASASASAPQRSSRKRSRASRRAPTTVLTTDTTNFRAMVQEFTGIPSPPFAAASAATYRSRFDHLFASPASSLRSVGVDPNSLPPYLLRPFAQKIQPFGFSSSSPSRSNIAIANTSANSGSTAFPLAAAAAAAASDNSSAPTADHNYLQLPSSANLGIGAGVGSYLSTIQDQGYVSFQNLLNSQLNPPPPKYDAGNMLGFGARPSASSTEFLSREIGLTTHGLIGSDSLQLHQRGHGHGSDELSGLIGAAAGAPAGTATDRGSSCKLIYSTAVTAAAEFNIENSQESGTPAATTTRGEGAVESWICSSE